MFIFSNNSEIVSAARFQVTYCVTCACDLVLDCLKASRVGVSFLQKIMRQTNAECNQTTALLCFIMSRIVIRFSPKLCRFKVRIGCFMDYKFTITVTFLPDFDPVGNEGRRQLRNCRVDCSVNQQAMPNL